MHFLSLEQQFTYDNFTVKDIVSISADQKEGLTVSPSNMPARALQRVIRQQPPLVPVFYCLCEQIKEDAAWLREHSQEHLANIVCVCVVCACGVYCVCGAYACVCMWCVCVWCVVVF